MQKPSRHWVGNGFHVIPVFAQLAFTKELSPWLMFDYAAPKEFAPTTEKRGVGWHPHRGFETITIAFQGEVEHSDSTNNQGVIGPGDVQWMTAGRGIVHQEFHSTNFARSGGTFEMAQLWLNLPAKHKMERPRYQPILFDGIPTVTLEPAPPAEGEPECEAGEGGSARIIAGELHGVRGPAASFSPVNLWELHLPSADTWVVVPVPDGHNCILFVRRGSLKVGGVDDEKVMFTQDTATMDRRGGLLRVSAAEPDTRLLVLGGEPIDEPIKQQGPFVMNTAAELVQANEDFRSGKFGG